MTSPFQDQSFLKIKRVLEGSKFTEVFFRLQIASKLLRSTTPTKWCIVSLWVSSVTNAMVTHPNTSTRRLFEVLV